MTEIDHNLVDLPAEIVSQILAYIIPIDHTFRLWSRREELADAWLRNPIKHQQYFHSWTTKLWEYRGPWQDEPGSFNVMPLLLIHPVIYPIVLTALYTNNVLWFPNLYTLNHFISQTSPEVRAAVITIAINACGQEYSDHGYSRRVHTWEHSAEISIADAIQGFPNLRDLRLGGVGPGIPSRVKQSTEWMDRYVLLGRGDRMLWLTMVPPGPNEEKPGEDAEVWPVDCMELVAKIVTSPPNKLSEHNANNASPQYQSPPLAHGRVFCSNLSRGPDHFTSIGTHRNIGTRILRHDYDTPTIGGEHEREITEDITAMLQLARTEHEHHLELSRRENGISSMWDDVHPVSVRLDRRLAEKHYYPSSYDIGIARDDDFDLLGIIDDLAEHAKTKRLDGKEDVPSVTSNDEDGVDDEAIRRGVNGSIFVWEDGLVDTDSEEDIEEYDIDCVMDGSDFYSDHEFDTTWTYEPH